jgi:ABC-2 type transport system ATP-binding protein
MDIVRTQSLLKCHSDYESFTLGHVNLKLGPGEILGIMGPAKAGKTTLLQLLWGFTRPTAGVVEVLGRVPYLHQIEVRRQAGYVAGKAAFYEWMTPQDFLGFVANFYPTWDQARADALLKDLGVVASTRVNQLSSEDKLKLRLIAALGHRPKLLLLDEPMKGESVSAWLEIQAFLKQLARTEAMTIVVSAGVSDDLDRLVDSVMMLNRGSVLRCEPSANLKQQLRASSLEDIFNESLRQAQRNVRRANA